MTRSENLLQAFMDNGGEVKGIAFFPLSPQRINTLIRRRNRLFVTERDRDQTDIEAMGEILFVATRTTAQMQALFRGTAEAWDLEAGEFLVGLPDGALEEFANDHLTPAMDRLKAAGVESEAAGK